MKGRIEPRQDRRVGHPCERSHERSERGEPTGRVHLAFQAKDMATVDLCHERAIAAGGKDNGMPGQRPYHPGYYAAFVMDPDGNNIEVVFHGPATKSVEAIEITFSG